MSVINQFVALSTAYTERNGNCLRLFRIEGTSELVFPSVDAACAYAKAMGLEGRVLPVLYYDQQALEFSEEAGRVIERRQWQPEHELIEDLAAGDPSPVPAKDGFLWKAVRAGRWGGVDVVGFKRAEPNSVLAGQILTCFIDSFPTEAAAFERFPEAREGAIAERPNLAHLPSEDDPVAGGMYLDDWND